MHGPLWSYCINYEPQNSSRRAQIHWQKHMGRASNYWIPRAYDSVRQALKQLFGMEPLSMTWQRNSRVDASSHTMSRPFASLNAKESSSRWIIVGWKPFAEQVSMFLCKWLHRKKLLRKPGNSPRLMMEYPFGSEVHNGITRTGRKDLHA